MVDNIIDLEFLDTYPKKALQIIEKYIDLFSDKIKEDISKCEVIYDIDIDCAVENYLCPYKAEDLYRKLKGIFLNYYFVVYHATRLMDNSIKKDGFYINKKEYLKYLEDIYLSEGFSKDEVITVIDIINDEYIRKYEYSNYRLNFFGNRLDFIGNNKNGYDQFCENLGGELARWGIQESHSKYYEPLKKGKPCLIKFKIKFSDIANYKQDDIIYEFVKFMCAKKFFRRDYKISFEANTEKKITGDNILEIIKIDE